jgi:hypothetical protein
VSAPHHGTTLASFFASLAGKPLLKACAKSAVRALRHGRLPLEGIVRAGAIVTRLDDRIGLKQTALDELYDALLGDFDDARRQELIELLERISSDQDLIFQLTPASMHLFNAANAKNRGTAYGCVSTNAAPPSVKTIAAQKHDVYAQALHSAYALSWLLASQARESHLPRLAGAQRRRLAEDYGEVPPPWANDGIVPTLSQIHGDVIHCARADHLDVVGHFGPGSADEIRADWLPTQDAFDGEAFEAVWNDVADYMVEEHERRLAPRRPNTPLVSGIDGPSGDGTRHRSRN